LEDHWATYGPDGSNFINYIAGQEEICPDTGRTHYQWWFQARKRVRFTQVAKLLPGRIHHITACDGSEEANEKYTKKSETGVEGTLFSAGAFSTQGKPTNMSVIVDLIKKGASYYQLYEQEAEFILRGHHANAITHAIPYLRPPPTTQVFNLNTWPTTGGWDLARKWADGDHKTTLLLWGPPGSGKTKWVHSLMLDGKPTLVIQTRDGLKTLTSKYSTLALDDWDEALSKMGDSELTNLFDRQVDVSLSCRFNDAVIPRNMAVVVVSNMDPDWLLHRHPGIPRRVTLVKVEDWDKSESLACDEKLAQFDGTPPAGCAEGDDDDKHEEYSPHSMAEWRGGARSQEGIEDYYKRLAEAEHREDTIEEAAAREDEIDDTLDDEVPGPLVRADAQVWSSLSSADAPRSRKRKKPATPEIIDLSQDSPTDPKFPGL